ncbi:helix-turn-helix domain-containing protein [Sphingobacterium faecale]|uniref:Helix-turn-helix domain-containing protein n=1 Tax=Sphingobacterium faecale TaxID=2803775 RepID=A0ABS1R4N9_9SPHI|nr:AraC family transcriptional regulator [Sphingobacterium faecale]MBL1409194.1 helix-turn-helix domain-containing protein [Sphingobacterium faecale]
MNPSVFYETTPLSEKDCFMVFSREKKLFDFPLHVHTEFEINFIENAEYAQRIVGDSIEEIGTLELALIANPHLAHGWFTHKCQSENIKEITIQFHADLFNEQILRKDQFRSIQQMLERGYYGIAFTKDKIQEVRNTIYELTQARDGFNSVIKLFKLLYQLSLDTNMRVLSSRSFGSDKETHTSRRINKAIKYLNENYAEDVKLKDVSQHVGMSDVSFCRFIKKRTGNSFVDTLNAIRLGQASRMLIDTSHSVSEIAWLCGFNNLSNFNRTFKKKRGQTPTEFRDQYIGSKFYF